MKSLKQEVMDFVITYLLLFAYFFMDMRMINIQTFIRPLLLSIVLIAAGQLVGYFYNKSKK